MKRFFRGITLIELMVATTLLALVIAGTLVAYSRSMTAFRLASTEQRLHERAQYAFATLERDLQMAGYFGAAGSPPAGSAMPTLQSAMACGADLLLQLDQPITVQTEYRLDCPAQGRGAQSGTQVVTVRRTSTRTAAPEDGRLQWLSSQALPQRGQLVSDGQPPASGARDSRLSELRNLVIHNYYIAMSADEDPATPALRVKSLTSIAGRPAYLDTEVMPGVEDLRLELLPVHSPMRSVRLTLGVRADAADSPSTEPPRRILITREFALRNAFPAQL